MSTLTQNTTVLTGARRDPLRLEWVQEEEITH